MAPDAATTFTIAFNPEHLGTRAATVRITSNDSANPTLTFAIAGLATTDHFNETYYLRQNPDVAAAVKAGAFTSGYQHFVLFGQSENRSPDAFYSESFCLAHNGDVAAAVKAGAFASGFEHFLLYGQSEGRPFSKYFDE